MGNVRLFDIESLPTKSIKRVGFHDCKSCGLYRGCKTPKMEPHGKGKLGIAVVAEAPGKSEDELGIPLIGKAGQLLRSRLRKFGIDLDEDCIKLNVLQCRPPNNRKPTNDELACCAPRVREQLTKFSPSLIFAFGSSAVASLLSKAPFGPSVTAMDCRVIPSYDWNAWVACGYHPSWHSRTDSRYIRWLDDCIGNGLEKLNQPLTDLRLHWNDFKIVEDVDELESLFAAIEREGFPVAFDYETVGLNPFAPRAKILTAAVAWDCDMGFVIPLSHPHAMWTKKQYEKVRSILSRWLLGPSPKIIQNWAFEALWTRRFFGHWITNVICDTMVRQHVLDNRVGTKKLDFQVFVRYGDAYSSLVNVEEMEREYLDNIGRYTALDVRYLMKLWQDQNKEMTRSLTEAYSLFHETLPIFFDMTFRGIPIDQKLLKELLNSTAEHISRLKTIQRKSPSLAEYVKKYSETWNPSSHRSLQRMFFGIFGLKPLKTTEGGTDLAKIEDCSTDSETMDFLYDQTKEGEEAQNLIEVCRDLSWLEKLNGYLKNFLLQSSIDGKIHPDYLLHVPTSYRSSSANPNFQNLPKRKKEQAELRRILVPQNDWFLEMDFSGAEVRMYATYSQDPTLVYNIRHDVDYHRRYAALLYEKDLDDITEDERYKGKNGFVFPEFYGDYWSSIATKNPQWKPERIREVEKIFWKDMEVLRKWQEDQETFYLQNGYLQLATGFVIRYGKGGCLKKNQIRNMPNQGTAFHRLLRALIDCNKKMKELGLKSVMVGQIHDSCVFDVFEDEVPDLMELANEIVVRPAWDWDVIVPWEVEWKIGKNLLDMEKLE